MIGFRSALLAHSFIHRTKKEGILVAYTSIASTEAPSAKECQQTIKTKGETLEEDTNEQRFEREKKMKNNELNVFGCALSSIVLWLIVFYFASLLSFFPEKYLYRRYHRQQQNTERAWQDGEHLETVAQTGHAMNVLANIQNGYHVNKTAVYFLFFLRSAAGFQLIPLFQR